MIDYYIHAVHQVDGIIEKVKICTTYIATEPTDEREKML